MERDIQLCLGQSSSIHTNDIFRMIAETEILSVQFEQKNRLLEILSADVKLTSNRGVSQKIRRMFNGWKQ